MSGLMRVESWKLRFVLEPFKRRGVASKKGRCLPFRCARFRTSCGDVGHWGRQGFLGNVVLPDMMPLNNNEKPENCSEKEKQRGHVVMQDGESSRKKREDHGCIMMYIMCIYIYIFVWIEGDKQDTVVVGEARFDSFLSQVVYGLLVGTSKWPDHVPFPGRAKLTSDHA